MKPPFSSHQIIKAVFQEFGEWSTLMLLMGVWSV